MIAPSLWRQHITKLASAIDKRAASKRLSAAAAMILEKDLMLAFFLIHRLLEEHRVPDHDGAIPIPADSYPSSGKMEYLRDTKNVRRSLLGQTAEPLQLKLGILTNKIIHSYLIVPLQSKEHESLRVVVCSEFEHNTRLFVLFVSDLAAVLRRIGEEPY